jgi:agmatinase
MQVEGWGLGVRVKKIFLKNHLHLKNSFLKNAALEGCFDVDNSIHVGIRGPLPDEEVLRKDAEMGFRIISCDDLDRLGVQGCVKKIRERIGDRPLYISVDIDVLDPAFAPGTGTPQAGGLSTRELLGVIR